MVANDRNLRGLPESSIANHGTESVVVMMLPKLKLNCDPPVAVSRSHKPKSNASTSGAIGDPNRSCHARLIAALASSGVTRVRTRGTSLTRSLQMGADYRYVALHT